MVWKKLGRMSDVNAVLGNTPSSQGSSPLYDKERVDRAVEGAREITREEFTELRTIAKETNGEGFGPYGPYRLDIARGVLLDTPNNQWAFEYLDKQQRMREYDADRDRMRPSPLAR